MRVHELDEHYGVSKDEVKAALAELGASTNHLSKPSDEVLAQLEERFTNPGEPLPDFSNEEREHPGTGEEMEPEEPAPEEPTKEVEAPPEAPKKDEEKPMANFEKVDMQGRLESKLNFEPGINKALKKAISECAKRLKKKPADVKVADSTFYPEEGKLVVVTWPDMQKLTVRAE